MTQVNTFQENIRSRLKKGFSDLISIQEVIELRFLLFLNHLNMDSRYIARVINNKSTTSIFYLKWCTWYEEFIKNPNLVEINQNILTKYILIKKPQRCLEKLLKVYCKQLEKSLKWIVRERWINFYLSQLVTITIGLTRNKPYNFKLLSTMKKKYPNFCCYCFIDRYDLETDSLRPKGTPSLLWLTETHEPNCKERPCPLANLNHHLLKLIWSFVVVKERLIEDFSFLNTL